MNVKSYQLIETGRLVHRRIKDDRYWGGLEWGTLYFIANSHGILTTLSSYKIAYYYLKEQIEIESIYSIHITHEL